MSARLMETAPAEESESIRMVLEASRVATEKMLDYYRRMGIKVTPQMTLAPGQDEEDVAKLFR
ncbi:MAG: hypothetical protein K1X78_07105 [Verrucomicrobiaceae bacterium]|nr:hypothetical protein [Verrucomicrobiaceae bacterium]